ncbi:MAG: Asp-tRNA(Asn)/Glu-tRNA(Gln) amidotransferase subunit GatA [Nitriliruptorales bacterium]|nr:Asp-tRNA(Asn)/Glu-tRNA(Gln) amidotransferase subunit GatA [Nitriliruptorales bacterium]
MAASRCPASSTRRPEVNPLLTAGAAGLRRLMEAGEVSAVEVTRAHLARIAATDDKVHAFLQVLDDQALATAADVDRRRAARESLGPLAGVPLALKDVLCTRGVETTCASRILEGYRPVYDATVVKRLREAGVVVLGKTNMDEFAMGSSTENSAFGPTRNPWDLDRVPGGSSGGSSAAIAALQAPLAIGTDTGGSIRQPAALCGVVGVKPTYGLVSRYGLIAFASSLDQVGPIARSVGDAALLLEAIAGHDPCDSTSIPTEAPSYADALERGVEGLRIGVVTEFMDSKGLAEGGRTRVEEAIRRLAKLGAEIVEVSMPHASYGVSAYYLIAPSEASSNLSRYDGVRYGLRLPGETAEQMMARTREGGFGREVKRRIMIGTYALSAGYYDAYYAQAQRVRTLIIRDFEAAYERCDVLVAPTAPEPAFPLGAKIDDPLAMYLNDVFTVPSSLAGSPALSLPVGVDEAGLPVGLQIMAPILGEATMLQAARALEADLDLDVVPHGARTLEAR